MDGSIQHLGFILGQLPVPTSLDNLLIITGVNVPILLFVYTLPYTQYSHTTRVHTAITKYIFIHKIITDKTSAVCT